MMLGISITSCLAQLWPGGPTLGDLHEHASLLGLVFALLHGLVLFGDSYIGFTLLQILVPFASSYLPLWVGLGVCLCGAASPRRTDKRSIRFRPGRTTPYLTLIVTPT
jgi:hypothetical protein